MIENDNPIEHMKLGAQAQSVETRLVRSKEGTVTLLIGINTAKAIDEIDGTVAFMTSECLGKKTAFWNKTTKALCGMDEYIPLHYNSF